MTTTQQTEATIEAVPDLPMIRITREFAAAPEQVFRAHIDPDLYARWVGPNDITTKIDHWEARNGGSWRFVGGRDGDEYAFRGCFHTVSPERVVQTFTWEGQPDDVSLETLLFQDLGDGRTRLVVESLCDSFAGRDAWLASGMEVGVNDGYAKLDKMLADGSV